MSVITVLVAADPILTWNEVRIDLRVDATDEQEYVEGLIADATSFVQARIGSAVGLQTVQEAFDAFDEDPVTLGLGPVVTIDGTYGDDSDPLGVFYVDEDGDEQVIDASVYGLNGAAVFLRDGQDWPTDAAVDPGSVLVRYRVGAETVGGGIRQAVRLLVRIHYERREPTDDEQRAIDTLLEPHRAWPE